MIAMRVLALFRQLIAFVLLATLLVGCAESPAPPTAVPAAVPTATLTFAATEARRAFFAPLIAAYNLQNPDAQVQFVPLAPDTALADAVRQADSVFGYPLRAEDVAAGLLRDLTPFADADQSFQADDFYPLARAIGQQSQRFLLPLALSVPLLDYNADLWAQQGLPPLDPTWTWDELLAAAEQLAVADRADIAVYGLYDPGGRQTLQAELASADIALMEGVALDQPALVTAVVRVQAQATRGVIATASRGSDANPSELIRTSRLGFWPSELTTAAQREGSLPFATARLPYPAQRTQIAARPIGAMISAGTQQPEATWRWLSFLSRQQIQPVGDGSAGVVVVPTRRSVAAATGVWEALEPTISSAIQALLERSLPLSDGLAGDPALVAALEQALDRVLTGNQSPAAALAEAQTMLDLPLVAAAPSPQPIAVATPALAQPDGTLTVIRFAPNTPR